MTTKAFMRSIFYRLLHILATALSLPRKPTIRQTSPAVKKTRVGIMPPNWLVANEKYSEDDEITNNKMPITLRMVRWDFL